MAKRTAANRKLLGIWLTEKEKKDFHKLAAEVGHESLSDFARALNGLSPNKRKMLRSLILEGLGSDGRDNYVMVRLRDGEKAALDALASEKDLAVEDLAYDQLRLLLGGRPSYARGDDSNLSPVDPSELVSQLESRASLPPQHNFKNPWPAAERLRHGLAPDVSLMAKMTMNTLAATYFAVHSVPGCEDVMNRIMGNWMADMDKNNGIYYGNPSSSDVTELLIVLRAVSREKAQEMLTKYNVDIDLVRTMWAQTLLHSKEVVESAKQNAPE